MLPSILAKQLQKGIGDYIETTFPMTNAPFKGSIQKMLQQKGAVYHEPYVAVRLPFRVANEMPSCFTAIHPAYFPYVHQEKAFARLTGDDGRSTLVATGTGSGKTECFLYPILEYCYRHRGERGIKALIIYPMNALASDQAKRIAELIYESPELRGNVTVGMYVGGRERDPSRTMSEHDVIKDHETMLNNAPDILMTNYKMLDYLLVRPKDALLWQDNDPETLKYIAVDELHTFDGAQGTDLACLLRRLKRRLGIYDGYLCCVGTSATMGTKENTGSILSYAQKIFGEPFDKESIITEDRLSAKEFFAGFDVNEFTMPSAEEARELLRLSEEDEASVYLREAVTDWFPDFAEDVFSDEGRIRLGKRLMHHSFMQSVIFRTEGNYYQGSAITEALCAHYPDLKNPEYASIVIDSLYALISHAGIGRVGSVRPFLNVQVQLWMRELRRLLAKVDGENVTYEIAHGLNGEQAKLYLPVVNCRDCGATGWVSVLDPQQNATMKSLESFYNMYFRGDDQIAMMFPMSHDTYMPGMAPAWICPCCLQVKFGEDGGECTKCGTEMISVMMPHPIKTSGGKNNKQFECPCCGSRRGLSLMGVRSATEISASISQMFASQFNDDKKTLAFSDNVQDAAHRAGFFNARTWRFGLRTAIQKYCTEGGAGQSLEDFQKGFLEYWHARMSEEEFIGFFIAPNMTWMRAYEEMTKNRKLGRDQSARRLMHDVENRIRYEIMLEFGMGGRIGRTLEKSGCSVISFATEDICEIADAVKMRTENEHGIFNREGIDSYRRMVLEFLNLLRTNGAFADPVFDEYIGSGGKSYMLTNDRRRWLPGLQSGRNIPHFLAENSGGRAGHYFDLLSAKKYWGVIQACSTSVLVEEGISKAIAKYIVEEAVKREVVSVVSQGAGYKVYGLNKNHVYISNQVVQMRCAKCGSMYAVSKENAELWEGAPCPRSGCGGQVSPYQTDTINYYGRLFSSGDLVRVNAKEHTGLLERDNREKLEIDFKRGKNMRNIWDPNVLSCTPTLEMGIDIGDLSSVILCSMPPAQSQFLQRAGRAGRKDGNALTLAIANAKPHDLYFYADPLEMIAGHVDPPEIFLNASAVLERQFVAFCMDSWVKKGIPAGAIPDRVGSILKKWDARPEDIFPFNFLNYVQSTPVRQINSFEQMFAGDLDEGTKEELRAFASGKGTDQSPMAVKILDAFEDLKKQCDALRDGAETLKAMQKELEGKPKDSAYEEELKELKSERGALLNVIRNLGKKNIFNFLSDEGLLPNYAFPEAGIILRAVLYRKEEPNEAESKRSYEKMTYEYSRSASSAISEFAPNNTFYADGRKMTIDQVDLTTAQSELWRLCPNCSHAQLEEAGKHTAACPQCGSPAWADAGQVRPMLKVQMVYSNMDYTKSLIGDESDDRTNTFYCKQLLVDVDEDHDITEAYQMDNEEFPFGYEFVRKATLREINFGESDSYNNSVGDKFSVSGEEEVRKGFKICKYCGKIQRDGEKPNHSFTCVTRKNPDLDKSDVYEECLFLYREFTTEILRLLIPATTMASTDEKTESFVAAFMLGMKEYFGNVDHLRATVSEVPVPGADYRKQYLVIYDSVPGGTGYLKQLMHNKNALVEVFERALHVLENCSCKDDPQKDGCYHCLYAYRQSGKIGHISRKTAIGLLKAILSGKDNVQKIEKINNIPVNPLFDSELELRFMEAVRAKAGAEHVKDIVRGGKHSYYVKIGDATWEVEPQVSLGAGDGVAVSCKPDFVFWPVSDSLHKPVAVFTDGFRYHKDIVADDTLKREAIRRSGNFRVWSLSFKDVQSVFTPQGNYCTETLAAMQMPSGTKMYHNLIQKFGAADIHPEKLSSFDLLMEYLKRPNAEAEFKGQARAYGMSMLDFARMRDESVFNGWKSGVDIVNEEMHFTDADYAFPGTAFGIWIPQSSDSYFKAYAGITVHDFKAGKDVDVCAVLKDESEYRTDAYEAEWNGFWRFWNMMQFCEQFAAVSSTGLAQSVYSDLPAETEMPEEVLGGDWNTLTELLLEESEKAFAKFAAEIGIPAPDADDIGYEIETEQGEVIATMAMAWPGRKIGFMTEDQIDDKEAVEALGWRILTADDMGNSDTVKFFGGDGE